MTPLGSLDVARPGEEAALDEAWETARKSDPEARRQVLAVSMREGGRLTELGFSLRNAGQESNGRRRTPGSRSIRKGASKGFECREVIKITRRPGESRRRIKTGESKGASGSA